MFVSSYEIECDHGTRIPQCWDLLVVRCLFTPFAGSPRLEFALNTDLKPEPSSTSSTQLYEAIRMVNHPSVPRSYLVSSCPSSMRMFFLRGGHFYRAGSRKGGQYNTSRAHTSRCPIHRTPLSYGRFIMGCYLPSASKYTSPIQRLATSPPIIRTSFHRSTSQHDLEP